MGYYTYFSLGVHDNKYNVNSACCTVAEEIEEKIAKELAKIIYEIGEEPTEHELESIKQTHDLYDVLNDSMKWYDHESDMCKLSAMFPDLYFTLEGDGEEADDYWRKLFHNGICIAVVDGEIYYPDFDINYWSENEDEN